MKQNKLKYLLLSAIISLSAQNAMASASAAAALEAEEGTPGLEGQTIRVSMFYQGEDAAPNCGTLTGFRLKLPNGSVKTVTRPNENDRLVVDDKFNVEGRTSFPVTLTYLSRYEEEAQEGGEDTILPWQGLKDIICENDVEKDMPAVEAIQIRWDSDGKCELRYRYKKDGPKTKAARS